MTFIFKDNFLSSDQDTNQFLVYMRIESQISYTTIRDFTSRIINITFFFFFFFFFLADREDGEMGWRGMFRPQVLKKTSSTSEVNKRNKNIV